MTKNKHAAMEMSVGTIVTIVLLMTVLILGLIMVRSIFGSSTDAIEGIDQAVKGEIDKLFSEDNSRKVVVYPTSREIKIDKGEISKGFGFSIRNIQDISDTFTYEVSATQVSCQALSKEKADTFISLGKSGEVSLPPGSFDQNGVFVRFKIPEEAPPCQVRYTIKVTSSDGQLYAPSVDVDLEIKSD